jgi:hypothetical protein
MRPVQINSGGVFMGSPISLSYLKVQAEFKIATVAKYFFFIRNGLGLKDNNRSFKIFGFCQ